MTNPGDVFGVFGLSSAVSAHLLSKHHHKFEGSWFENKWFWAGLFGNLPALVAFIAHIYFSGDKGEETSK